MWHLQHHVLSNELNKVRLMCFVNVFFLHFLELFLHLWWQLSRWWCRHWGAGSDSDRQHERRRTAQCRQHKRDCFTRARWRGLWRRWWQWKHCNHARLSGSLAPRPSQTVQRVQRKHHRQRQLVPGQHRRRRSNLWWWFFNVYDYTKVRFRGCSHDRQFPSVVRTSLWSSGLWNGCRWSSRPWWWWRQISANMLMIGLNFFLSFSLSASLLLVGSVICGALLPPIFTRQF